jgi:hypothetical protein
MTSGKLLFLHATIKSNTTHHTLCSLSSGLCQLSTAATEQQQRGETRLLHSAALQLLTAQQYTQVLDYSLVFGVDPSQKCHYHCDTDAGL